MSSLSARRCVHRWPTWVFMFVRSSRCLFVYRTAAHFKPLQQLLRVENSDTDVRSNVERRLQAIQTLSPSDPRMNGWINKSLFRIVFGEGIVPAALPLGPWLELRESTLCSAPGGYEEQMSCLLPSSSRLKAAHTSLKRTSWKAEPQKLLELFCTSIFRRQLAGLKRFEGRADLLQARSAAASGVSSQCSVTSLWCRCRDVPIAPRSQQSLLKICLGFYKKHLLCSTLKVSASLLSTFSN